LRAGFGLADLPTPQSVETRTRPYSAKGMATISACVPGRPGTRRCAARRSGKRRRPNVLLPKWLLSLGFVPQPNLRAS